jgi:hypothetical protein
MSGEAKIGKKNLAKSQIFSQGGGLLRVGETGKIRKSNEFGDCG